MNSKCPQLLVLAVTVIAVGCSGGIRFRESPTSAAGATKVASEPSVPKPTAGEALINATKAGNLKRVEQLLDNGADPNAVVQTNTALIFAARDGELEIAQLLIDRGANVNWIDGEGVTPLILAAFKDHQDIAALLLAHGADVTVRDQWQRTALNYALRRGETDEIARMIQEKL